jgi:hypothetical protein
MESIDNSRKGYPTPLPPWFDWTSRYLIGLFTLLIDFTFFVLPLLVLGIISLCGSIAFIGAATTNAGPVQFWFAGATAIGVLLVILAFGSGIAPLARLRYAEEGRIEQALSVSIVRQAWHRPTRGLYLGARLRSLIGYLPFIVLGGSTMFIAQFSFNGQFLVVGLLLWLTWTALLYAHLIVGQFYVAAEREVQRRIMATYMP